MKKGIIKQTLFITLLSITFSSTVSCNKNEDYQLTPVSEELVSYYLYQNANSGGMADPVPRDNVSTLYDLYKEEKYEGKDTRFKRIVSNAHTLSLNNDGKYHCYYISKKTNKVLNKYISENKSYMFYCGPIDVGFSHDLNLYLALCNSKELNYEDNKLYEIVFDSPIEHLPININGYCFVDVATFYSDLVYAIDRCYIDFVPFIKNTKQVLINEECINKNLKYWTYSTFKSKYEFIRHIDYFSLNVKMEDNIEYIEEKFRFEIGKGEDYYSDLEPCIISKILDNENTNTYNTRFDYLKLMELFYSVLDDE